MDKPITIQDLRDSLRSRFGAEQEFLPPQSEEMSPPVSVQETVEYQPGRVHEIVATSPSAGVGCLIERMLREPGDQPIALIDGRSAFGVEPTSDPSVFARLLWLQCHSASDAVRSADWLLRDGNVPLVILDLQLNPVTETRGIGAPSWHRLRKVTRDSHVVLLVFTSEKTISCADLRFRLGGRPLTLADLDREREAISVGLIPERDRTGSCVAVESAPGLAMAV